VGYRLFGVIGDGESLDGLRHPSMHPVHELRHGLGLCAVRTRAVLDDPVADAPGQLLYLTSSVLDYIEAVSQRTPVVYVTAEFAGGTGDQAACGWSEGALALGPLTSHHERPPRSPRSFRRVVPEDTGAIDAALGWLGVPQRRGCDRFEAVGLADRREWEA
jgi:hypothetical protein